VERDPLAYDARCLACHGHSAGAKPAGRAEPKTCSVATSRCVTCHMPKYEVEEMRFSFTDHLIRVVRGR
jgi:mono/diheme cytochrome c family protein